MSKGWIPLQVQVSDHSSRQSTIFKERELCLVIVVVVASARLWGHHLLDLHHRGVLWLDPQSRARCIQPCCRESEKSCEDYDRQEYQDYQEPVLNQHLPVVAEDILLGLLAIGRIVGVLKGNLLHANSFV